MTLGSRKEGLSLNLFTPRVNFYKTLLQSANALALIVLRNQSHQQKKLCLTSPLHKTRSYFQLFCFTLHVYDWHKSSCIEAALKLMMEKTLSVNFINVV